MSKKTGKKVKTVLNFKLDVEVNRSNLDRAAFVVVGCIQDGRVVTGDGW